jgi:hypothetical protein
VRCILNLPHAVLYACVNSKNQHGTLRVNFPKTNLVNSKAKSGVNLKITLGPTEEFFRTDEGFPVRAWKGTTDQGTPIIAFIAGISAQDGFDYSKLEAELKSIPGPNVSQTKIHPS